MVSGSIAFYKNLFWDICALDWPSVCTEASKCIDTLQKICPRYLEEIRGLAEGAEVGLLDIVALNVRTEITFGLFTKQPKLPIGTDGCTSLAYKSSRASYLSQNWDWQVKQAPNLIICHVSQPGTDIPGFKMVTEAGVIGKIGLNEKGVGVCLNAIRARGVNASKLPVHLALRAVLESASRSVAVETLKGTGVAGSGHILIADETGSTGLECTSKGIRELQMDGQGRIIHTNHIILDHPDVDEPPWLEDSPVRLSRMSQLFDERIASSQIDMFSIFDMFKDEYGYPGSINRSQEGDSETQTLFNIVMDLNKKRAIVTFGRPTVHGERVQLVL